MGIKLGVIPEGVNHHDHLQDTEEHLQALAGTVAKLGEELPVVLEVDAQHDRDAEDELSMGDWIEDVVGNVFPELNGFLGMATGAEPAPLA